MPLKDPLTRVTTSVQNSDHAALEALANQMRFSNILTHLPGNSRFSRQVWRTWQPELALQPANQRSQGGARDGVA